MIVEFDPDKQALTIHWLDGHESLFLADEISNWAIFALKSYDECASRTLWDNQKLKEIPSVSSKSFDFAVFSRLLVRFGVVAVLGVDHRNEKATRKLCESVAPIQNTFFGDFWIFGADTEHKTSEEREDTAYGSDEIGPHTDGTYFDQTPGIQVFHCLKPADEGGESVLVDGFAVAETLRTRHPEHFEILSRMPIAHQYIEGGFKEPQDRLDIEEDVLPLTKVDPNKRPLFARSIIHPVITLFKHKTVQIRYNPYDRAPLHSLYPESGSGSLEKTVKLYEAYEQLSRLVHESQAALTVKLLPGTVLFIDNYRVLHGRTAYKGNRRMCGCYLSRDNLLAKARPVLSSAFSDV